MIPVRLQLQNFLSYGEQVPPLDFGGLKLACLTGDNGNGKSALLDAITWALFNETRASTDDDVIRLGAQDAQVYFDFLVGDTQYRVHRGRNRRGGSQWEFQVWQEDGSLRTLSGANARETKASIEGLLRMDYKTFLATGYLAQGRADEFARATVTERKKVLADILDLSRYERLEELAKERAKDAQDLETDAERELSAIARQLEDEDHYHVRLEDAQRRRIVALEEADALQVEIARLTLEVQSREHFEQRANDLKDRMAEKAQENDQDLRLLDETRARVANADAIASRAEQITDAYTRFQSLSERARDLEEKAAQVASLQGEARQLERAIRTEEEKLSNERYRVSCEVAQLEEEAREIGAYEQELQKLEFDIARFGDLNLRADQIEVRRTKAEEDFAHFGELRATEKAQTEALQLRLNALQGSDAALCEYCGQPLPPARRQAAIAEAETEYAGCQSLFKQIVADARGAKTIIEQARREYDDLRREQAEINKIEARRNHATQEQFRLEERGKALPERRKTFARLDQQLTGRAFSRPQQERLMQVSAELEKLERAVQEWEDTRRELNRYRDAERQQIELANAQTLLRTEPARALELEARIADRDTKMLKAREQFARFTSQIADLANLRKERDTQNAHLKTVQITLAATEREIGDYEARLSRFAAMKQERERWQKEKARAGAEKDNYRELQAAFSKKGVQALIIENTLPEIQEAANEMLQKMTGGAMTVQLLSQKERKTKTKSASDAIETLDIIISDEMGQRPYEMYSGGEAFRVNFALRVALSKMLARRAGAPLQTLILDEGFGTQDPRGREAIVDALNSLGDEFALILVITHIEELKEAFPNRIEVVKGPNGSTFTVA